MSDSIRRRKTLGTLDQNFIQSHVPVPSSVLKKSNPSNVQIVAKVSNGTNFASRNQSNSGGTRNPSSRIFSGDNMPELGRPSVLRLSSTDMRRSSVYGSSMRQSSFQGTTITKDPRPIRDKQFQSQCLKSIVNFFTSSGFPQAVTHKTLTNPTQKDFFAIFKWLYNRIDPHYQFMKKIDDEIMSCMKSLRYPFVESLSRSQLMAIGSPHSLPSILAMLNWLVTVVNATDSILSEPIALEDDELYADNLFFDYLSKAYHVFLAGDDDFSEMEKELEQEFDEKNQQILIEIEKIRDDTVQLQRKYEKLEQSFPSLAKLEQERQVLKSDKEKFEQYIDHLKRRKAKFKDLNARIKQEIDLTKAKEQELSKDLVKQQNLLSSQDILPADIDKMTSDRDFLNKSLDSVVSNIQKLTRETQENERIYQEATERLTALVENFNNIAYKIGLIPETAKWAAGVNYELVINRHESERAQDILNLNLHETRPQLSRVRGLMSKKLHQQQDESLQVKELLDKVQEGLLDHREELETFEAKLSTAMDQYNEMRDTLVAEASSANAEIERLERDLYQLKITAQNGHLQVEQRAQSVGIEYDQLAHAANSVRESLYSETWKILEDVIQFKIHIQKSLEALESEVDTVSNDLTTFS